MAARKGVGKVLGRAAMGPLNLSVLGAAAVGAIALASWPIGALGGAAYVALVASDLSSAEFIGRALFGRVRPAKLPAPDAIGPSSTRSRPSWR